MDENGDIYGRGSQDMKCVGMQWVDSVFCSRVKMTSRNVVNFNILGHKCSVCKVGFLVSRRVYVCGMVWNCFVLIFAAYWAPHCCHKCQPIFVKLGILKLHCEGHLLTVIRQRNDCEWRQCVALSLFVQVCLALLTHVDHRHPHKLDIRKHGCPNVHCKLAQKFLWVKPSSKLFFFGKRGYHVCMSSVYQMYSLLEMVLSRWLMLTERSHPGENHWATFFSQVCWVFWN